MQARDGQKMGETRIADAGIELVSKPGPVPRQQRNCNGGLFRMKMLVNPLRDPQTQALDGSGDAYTQCGRVRRIGVYGVWRRKDPGLDYRGPCASTGSSRTPPRP